MTESCTDLLKIMYAVQKPYDAQSVNQIENLKLNKIEADGTVSVGSCFRGISCENLILHRLHISCRKCFEEIREYSKQYKIEYNQQHDDRDRHDNQGCRFISF